MKFGSETTTTTLDNTGSTLATAHTLRDGEVIKTLKTYSIRVKVANAQQEMTEFIRWSDDIKAKRIDGSLVLETDYVPAFSAIYPKSDQDGSYFIVRTWTEKHI